MSLRPSTLCVGPLPYASLISMRSSSRLGCMPGSTKASVFISLRAIARPGGDANCIPISVHVGSKSAARRPGARAELHGQLHTPDEVAAAYGRPGSRGSAPHMRHGAITRWVLGLVDRKAFDTSKDHVWTNWAGLAQFADDFVASAADEVESTHNTSRVRP
jgi:hypothetical protein